MADNIHFSFSYLKEKYKQDIRTMSEEDALMEQISTMFTYTDLSTIDTRFIEAYLLVFGKCAIWRVDEENRCFSPTGKLIVSRCDRAGSPNVNGLGKDLICTTENGIVHTFLDFEKSNDVVLIRNNKYATPDFKIPKTAQYLAEIEKSLLHNILNARYTPIIVARDVQVKKAIETALKENNNGQPQVVLSDNLFDANKEVVLNITDVTQQDKIQYLNHAVDDILRQFFNFYGLDTCGASKQAQQTVDEINSGCNARRVIPHDRKESRESAIAEINKKFGLSASVDFSEPWKIEFEKNKKGAENGNSSTDRPNDPDRE